MPSLLWQYLVDTQQPWKAIPVVPDNQRGAGAQGELIGKVLGCSSATSQPWDGAQGVSRAVRVCILPALLIWVGWAVPARLALWLGCSVQVVLEPRVTSRMFSSLPWGPPGVCPRSGASVVPSL